MGRPFRHIETGNWHFQTIVASRQTNGISVRARNQTNRIAMTNPEYGYPGRSWNIIIQLVIS